MPQLHYIYLVHETKFHNPHQNIYKIGRTSRNPHERTKEYEKGSTEILISECDDSFVCERELLDIFAQKFKQIFIYDRIEHFEGNKQAMKDTINNYLSDRERKISNLQNSSVQQPNRKQLFPNIAPENYLPVFQEYDKYLNGEFVLEKYVVKDYSMLCKLLPNLRYILINDKIKFSGIMDLYSDPLLIYKFKNLKEFQRQIKQATNNLKKSKREIYRMIKLDNDKLSMKYITKDEVNKLYWHKKDMNTGKYLGDFQEISKRHTKSNLPTFRTKDNTLINTYLSIDIDVNAVVTDMISKQNQFDKFVPDLSIKIHDFFKPYSGVLKSFQLVNQPVTQPANQVSMT
jgi:hypothetical protein